MPSPDRNGTGARSTAIGKFIGSPELTSDVMGWLSKGLSNLAFAMGGNVFIGTVVRSGGMSYDCTVYVEGREIPCTILQPVCTSTFGYSSGYVPIEGTKVVVLVVNKLVGPGFVVGVVPAGWFCTPNSDGRPVVKSMYPWDPVGYRKHRPYIEPVEDDKYPLKVSSPSRRFADYLPGEWAVTNEQNVGFRADMFSYTVMGGGSYIRVTRIDDEIRARSTNLTLWTDYRVARTFNDEGYISSEEYGCAYQSERMGEAVGGVPLSSKEAGDRCRPRQMRFGGFLAGVDFSLVARPDGGVGRFDGDNGVYSDHVSESGKSHVRSAGGISLERYAKIPLVRRVKKASDPEADHPERIKFEPNLPFGYSDEQQFHPYELYDAVAWEQQNIYRRFDEHEKDWETQEEPDMREPADSANDPQKSREDFSRNSNRRAGVFINEDGSVVIRDAFGDEIVMNGGMIRMSTPGSVSVMANRHFSVWANDSAVVKSRDGIAELCSEGGTSIVRGGRSVHVLGGRDGSPDGSVIVEALGSGVASNERETPLSNDVGGGVVLKAMNSEVALGGAKVAITSRDETNIYSGAPLSDDGVVQISAGRTYTSSSVQASISSGSSMVVLNGNSVSTIADGTIASLAGGSNITVQNRTKYAAPIWADVDDPVTRAVSKVEKDNGRLQRKAGTFYSILNFEHHVFGKEGSPSDYRTDRGQEGYRASGGHTEFEPFWILWKDHFKEIGSSPRKWYETQSPFNGTMAFPGGDPVGTVLRKTGFVNLDGVYGKNRKELVKDDGSTLRKDPILDIMV